jgi:hypothetical protein
MYLGSKDSCAWGGGTFFQFCHCVSFLVLVGNSFWCYLRTYYSCGIVPVFWFRREIVFGVTYVLRVQYRCAVVSVVWLWWEIILKEQRNRYSEVPAKMYSTKNTQPPGVPTKFFKNCRKPPSYVPYKGTYVPYDCRTNVLLARLTKVRR